MTTLRLPIRFNGDYTMQVIEAGSEEYYATLIANTLRIEPEELPISTSFGILDPSFGTETPLKTVTNAARFIPEITIEKVSSKLGDDGKVELDINFSIKE